MLLSCKFGNSSQVGKYKIIFNTIYYINKLYTLLMLNFHNLNKNTHTKYYTKLVLNSKY